MLHVTTSIGTNGHAGTVVARRVVSERANCVYDCVGSWPGGRKATAMRKNRQRARHYRYVFTQKWKECQFVV